MNVQIQTSASDRVRAILAGMGRTEDLKISPDNRRLAIAGYAKNRIIVLDMDIADTDTGKQVTLSDFLEISSPSLRGPHGLFFIDDETLIVANRGGGAPILRLPPSGTVTGSVNLTALKPIGAERNHLLFSPGSVSVSRNRENLYEVLICNNYAHYVTRHVLDGKAGFAVRDKEILLEKGLNIPDGIATSPDGHWIAISNHTAHSVFMFENTPELNRNAEPSCILGSLSYPHGLRFTADGNFVLVADAGAPVVQIYARGGSDWQGIRTPVATLRVMDQSAFHKGQVNPQEGGPKGIDIDSSMSVLAVTSEHQVLAFFDVSRLLRKLALTMTRDLSEEDGSIYMPMDTLVQPALQKHDK